MDEKQITYVYNDEMYDFDYIITQGYGRCQPNGVSGSTKEKITALPRKFDLSRNRTDELADRHTNGASRSYKHSSPCCS